MADTPSPTDPKDESEEIKELSREFKDFSEILSGDEKTIDDHSGKMTEYIRIIEKGDEAVPPPIGLEVHFVAEDSFYIDEEKVTFDEVLEQAGEMAKGECIGVKEDPDSHIGHFQSFKSKLREKGFLLEGDDPPWLAEAKREFWSRAMKQLKASARAHLSRFPPGIIGGTKKDIDALVREVYENLAKLLAGKVSSVRVNDRKHFYRLAAKNFYWALLTAVRKKKAERKRQGGPTLSIDHPNFDPGNVRHGSPRGNKARDPENEEISSKKVELIFELVKKMPQDLADVFNGRHVHKLSYAAMSEETGIPISTLNDRYQRALLWLQNKVRDQES